MSTAPSNTNPGVLAAGIYPALAGLRNASPPLVQRFARVFGVPGMFYFVPGDQSQDDGFTVIVPTAGGGAWKLERIVDQGPNLTAAASQTIGVYGGLWQLLPAGLPLSANVTITLDPTGALKGDTKELTRFDVTSYTVAIVNGGPGAGTLTTFAGSAKSWGLFWFDGTNYLYRRGGVMP